MHFHRTQREEFAWFFEAVVFPGLVIVMLGAMALAVLILYPLVPYVALALISVVLAGLTALWELAGFTWLQVEPETNDRQRQP